ncbi:MAG: 4Fe-4S dicluster domain-containing protein, partial [Planctomycetes bacterium]|nr:4Fe-4S dicluster domain-containing protein [Planctomycetota bacterium]
DARSEDGTASTIQPLIAPLYNGRSPLEVLAVLLGRSSISAAEIVREYWQWTGGTGGLPTSAAGTPPEATGGQATRATQVEAPLPPAVADDRSEDLWQTALHHGFFADTAFEPLDVSLRDDLGDRIAAAARRLGDTAASQPMGEDGKRVSLVFAPDPSVWDGRFANNAWLQELPRPLTSLTWDNAALVSPATATRLGLDNGAVVELRRGKRKIAAPVWRTPGHPDDTVTLHLGYGRERAGRVGNGAGFDAYRLRTTDAMWFASDATLHTTGRTAKLVSTQHHHLMHNRDIARAGTLDELREHPEHPHFAHPSHHHVPPASLYPEWEYPTYKWGMVIDLTACIGCNACTIACQAENNIPVVGKQEVDHNREMHWIRIDTYYRGERHNPETYMQPVPCMHCEKAPCEPVCPVAATSHSSEGLNEMTYNRCVGTRYCSNNCPYKVRRFNFLDYTTYRDEPVVQLQHNPDVTVRERGVMEKCTYCVQRINEARITAQQRTGPDGKEGRIADGDVVTACQAVCPTNAIVFGDLNDQDSHVHHAHASPLNYALLEDLNTQPRTTYLAAVRNPNHALEPKQHHGGSH